MAEASDGRSTQPESRPGENGTSPGCLVAMAIAIVIVVAVIGYVVSVGISIGGMMDDAVPHSDLFSPSGELPATTVAPRPSGTATTQGADCRSGYMLSFPTGADLRNCPLPGAYLPQADFTGSDLSGANLSYAYLDGANFAGANLTGANLASARLIGVTWSNTTCPDGSNSDSHGNTCVGYGV